MSYFNHCYRPISRPNDRMYENAEVEWRDGGEFDGVIRRGELNDGIGRSSDEAEC